MGSIGVRDGGIVCAISFLVSISDHRPCLEGCRVSQLRQIISVNSRFSRDVTKAILVYRTIASLLGS